MFWNLLICLRIIFHVQEICNRLDICCRNVQVQYALPMSWSRVSVVLKRLMTTKTLICASFAANYQEKEVLVCESLSHTHSSVVTLLSLSSQ